MKLKESLKVIRKNNIYYVLDDKAKIKKFKPWLGDIFAFLYDRIMQKSVFPKKFNGYIEKHNFTFTPLLSENGALLYFNARLKN